MTTFTTGRLLRACPWPGICLTTGLSAALFVLARALLPSPVGFWLLLLSLSACGAAAAYVLDEDAAPVVDASPTSRTRRIGWRLVVLLFPASVGIGGLAMVGNDEPDLPWRRLVLVLVGYLAIGVAVAAVLQRNELPAPGDLAAVLVAAGTWLAVVVDPLHRWIAMLPGDPDASWGRTAALWSGVIALSAVTLLVALRDPAARQIRRR